MMEKYVTGLQHIGIPTNDMKESLKFYEKLGFENIYQTVDKEVTVVFLRYEKLVLEIYENGQAVGKDGSVDHFALDVKNIEPFYEEMKAAGYTMLTPGINELPFWDRGIKFFIIEGPNKERIEFCEIL